MDHHFLAVSAIYWKANGERERYYRDLSRFYRALLTFRLSPARLPE